MMSGDTAFVSNESGMSTTASDVTSISTWHELRVARVARETADALSIVFEVPPDLAHAFQYHAGQFLTLKIAHEGKELSRCYSLASSPDCDAEHKVTVKRVPDGRVSNWLVDNVRAGDVLRVAPPGGRFTLTKTDTPLVLFAAGSGITPVISLLKSALVTTGRPCKLVYANADVASIIFRAELDRIYADYGERFTLFHHLDVDRGFLRDTDIRGHVVDVLNGQFYVCGPGPFMDTVERALLALAVPAAALHFERFVSPPDPGATPAAAVYPASEGGEVAPKSIRVYLDGRTRELPYEQGKTVLATVQQAGLEPPFSCTEGFCGCCMARLRAGRVRLIRNDFLSPQELEEGWVLTCQSIPVSEECSVEYPD
jgi:3-ketosteroid 9alpha-monooxygenase subunit B